MKKITELNVEDFKAVGNKVTILNKNLGGLITLKCFRNFDTCHILEAKKTSLLKLHKSIFLNIPNLITLDLRQNKLIKISKHLALLKNLTTLKLDDNQIVILPDFLFNMDKLDNLSLNSNKLTRIPNSIVRMQKLKSLKIANNILHSLPIELGELRNLECLHIESNYFVEIPTTLCYLVHLSELSFDWLEFLEPPYQKNIKESIGKTIINFIKTTLQEMIKQGILFCSFKTFVEKNSNSNQNSSFNDDDRSDKNTIHSKSNIENKSINEESKVAVVNSNIDKRSFMKKNIKIFYAIENNYHGIIKALVEEPDNLFILNHENRTPLYFALNSQKIEICNILINKMNLKLMKHNQLYLHKAIRMRNPDLVRLLLKSGIDPNEPDEHGHCCFHILFANFNKNLVKCSLIGDLLVNFNANLNSINNESWTPFHIAARKGNKECLSWILNQNKSADQKGQKFDINMKGKNDWTGLHLAANSYKIEEVFLLLNSGCNVFAKNNEKKTPRKVTNGNFLLTKLIRNYEEFYLKKRYCSLITLFENNTQYLDNQFYPTCVEEVINYDDLSYWIKSARNNDTWRDETSRVETEDNKDKNKTVNAHLNKMNKKDSFLVNNMNTNTLDSKRSMPKHHVSENKINIHKPQDKQFVQPIKHQKSEITITQHNKLLDTNDKRIDFVSKKELILKQESSIFEKYEAVMALRLAPNCKEKETTIKLLLEKLFPNRSNPQTKIIINDICNIITTNKIFNLIAFLEKLIKEVPNEYNEIKNTVVILKSLYQSLRNTSQSSYSTTPAHLFLNNNLFETTDIKDYSSNILDDKRIKSSLNDKKTKDLILDERLVTDESQKSTRKNAKDKNSLVMNNLNKYFAKEIAKHDKDLTAKVETKKVASTKKISKLAEKPTEKHSEKQILESKDSKESRIPTVNDESCNVKNTDISFVKQDGESQVVKPTNSFKIAEGLLSAPKYQDYSAFDTEK